MGIGDRSSGIKTAFCLGRGCGNSVAINSSSSSVVIELKVSGSPSETQIGSGPGDAVAWESGEDDEDVSIGSEVLELEDHWQGRFNRRQSLHRGRFSSHFFFLGPRSRLAPSPTAQLHRGNWIYLALHDRHPSRDRDARGRRRAVAGREVPIDSLSVGLRGLHTWPRPVRHRSVRSVILRGSKKAIGKMVRTFTP